jgi:hypothetical protein
LLVDLLMAAAVLGIALAVSVHLIGRLAIERRALDRRQFAVVAAGNVLERAAARPYVEVTAAALAEDTVDHTTARMLVRPRLAVHVRESERPAGKWITVEVRWPGVGGIDERPVRLTTWRARLEGGGQ